MKNAPETPELKIHTPEGAKKQPLTPEQEEQIKQDVEALEADVKKALDEAQKQQPKLQEAA